MGVHGLRAAISKLYENVDIRAEDEPYLERVEVEPFLRFSSKPVHPFTVLGLPKYSQENQILHL